MLYSIASEKMSEKEVVRNVYKQGLSLVNMKKDGGQFGLYSTYLRGQSRSASFA